MKRFLLPILLIATLLAAPGAAQHGPTALAANDQPALLAAPSVNRPYIITDLSTLGGNLSKAFGINESNQVVGWSNPPSANYHAFLWEDGTISNLGDLGGPESFAYGINDAGQVVGGSPTPLGYNYTHAFRWQNGVMHDLGTLGGTYSAAFAINSSGHAVGYARDADGVQHATLWGNSGIVDLGDLDPVWPTSSAAYGINDAGHVVGNSGTADPAQIAHAFLWSNGLMKDLGTLGGDYSSATAINTDGHVVGTSKVSGGTTVHAFLWQSGAMQDLGALGWNSSYANDINDKGQVVGTLQTGQNYHAFIWANGQMQDLNNLIPSDSGWVLTEAQAINDKSQIVGFGTINGQTRAFLLSPVYHWVNAGGGSWHVPTNWDPQGDPGDGDTVIFALSGQYVVDAGPTVSAAAPASNFPVGRMIISGTNTVDFNNLSLNLLNDSVTEPALTVNDGGTVKITSGAGNYIHATVGGAPPENPSNPPIARLQVFNSGTSLSGTGRLVIGGAGIGDLFVANGGQLTSAEARLGDVQPGTAAVGGDGSLWQTGSIAVGYGVIGTLSIENGGRVNSNTAAVGFGSDSNGSLVTIDGAAPGGNPPSLWTIEGDLTIGQGDSGLVDVLNGGQLAVNQNVAIVDGSLTINGRLANGSPSYLAVMDTVLVGGSNGSVLAFYNGARGDIYGDLILGQGGIGNLILTQATGFPGATNLSVSDSLFGTCLIGREFMGEVIINTDSSLNCRNVELGLAGTGGLGIITLDGGYLSASEIVRVGQATSGGGWIEMGNNATVVAGVGMHIAPNGLVSGSGVIIVGIIGVMNEGTLSPGITVLTPPLANALLPQAQTQDFLATMNITGTLTISPTGRLEIPITGINAGQYGSLAVTGAAHLDGVLALDFRDGYAPRRGDTFTFLNATEGISGAFDSVAISGLPPGFEYKLTTVGGHLALEALNDGVPSKTVFLPLVRR